MLKHKPAFIEAIYASKSTENADSLIMERIKRGALKIDKGLEFDRPLDILSGNLGTQLESFTKGHIEDEDSLPAVMALRALMAGYERLPYRRR